MHLDKSSPVPLYFQLAELLRDEISAGRLKPGDRIPGERELTEAAGISRMTVRQALGFLIRRGELVAEKGRGTYVARPKLTSDALHLLGFTENMIRQGLAATSRVLELATIVPPTSVMQRLRLNPGETAVKIVRLRISQDVPLLLETVYLPSTLCPGLELEDLTAHSLYALLEERYSLHLKRAEQTLEATTANEYEANLFGLRLGAGMILLEGVAYLDNERPVECFKAVYRGDRFRFGLESQRETGVTDASAAPRWSVMLSNPAPSAT